MRAVVCHQGQFEVADLPAPRPAAGQVLLDVTRAGICGSDLHARLHADEQADVLAESGYQGFMRAADRVVFGHEFTGTVAAYGAGCRKRWPVGAPVVALPLTRTGGQAHPLGLSPDAPGAYAEQVLVEESMTMAVPAGLRPDLAALTEPMAIGMHAVNRAEIGKKDVAVVIGCGPVGLAVISVLKAKGVRRVIASDLSAGRRALATACGADLVVDPRKQSPWEASRAKGHLTSVLDKAELGLDVMGKLNRLPVPWHRVWRALDAVGATAPKRPVVFECVGVPGMIEQVVTAAPLDARIVVVGVCMTTDAFRPSMAINKELDLRFVLGYSPLEFRDTLHLIADGTLNAAPIITGTVGLDGVAQAFTDLADPERHAKVLIDPSR